MAAGNDRVRRQAQFKTARHILLDDECASRAVVYPVDRELSRPVSCNEIRDAAYTGAVLIVSFDTKTPVHRSRNSCRCQIGMDQRPARVVSVDINIGAVRTDLKNVVVVAGYESAIG